MDPRRQIARAKTTAAPSGERSTSLGLLLVLVLVIITAQIMGAALTPAI